MLQKFTNKDRRLVIQELENIQKSKLEPINNSRKYFLDDNGLEFLLIGGKSDWHGVSKSTLNQLLSVKKEGVLVLIKKFRTRLEVFAGSLLLLKNNIDKLPSTKAGGVQFHIVLSDNGYYLKEIPTLICNKITEIKISDSIEEKRNSIVSKIININL